MKAEKRIARLRAYMVEESLDAIVVQATSDLLWLSGFAGVFDEEQAHCAVVTAEACVIHTDSRYATAMRDAAQEEGLWEVDDGRASVAAFVASVLQRQGLSKVRIAIDSSTSIKLFRAYEQKLCGHELVECEGIVVNLRAVKDEAEIAALKHAQEIASASFLEVIEHLSCGKTEREVSLELEFSMRSRGAESLAFPNIVASGPHSANPHALPSDKEIERGDFVVFDFGARVDGYRSDTTRTVVMGSPSERQQEIHAAIREANELVQKALKPQVLGSEMQALAESVLAKHGFAAKMGHGLGHGVGIDIHEMPLLSSRYAKPIACNSVITDEPGVYLAGELGARLEDCGVVREDGFESFCDLTHELIVVE